MQVDKHPPVAPWVIARGGRRDEGLDRRLLLMHQVMLGDEQRLGAYERALGKAVSLGDVVIDLGAGTLILTLLALRHGAGHVYAVEADPRMAALAMQIVDDNGLHDRVTVVPGDARSIRLPERADVLVCEMMGNIGPEEEMAEIMAIAARRHLKPGGRLVPEAMVTHIQAISFDNEGWGVWNDNVYGYSLSSVQNYVQPSAQLHFFSRPPKLLSTPLAVAENRLGQSALQPRGRHRLAIERPGSLHAIALYFSAQLAPDIVLSNFPSYPGCNWAVWVWPVRHTEVKLGDVVHVEIKRPSDVRIATDWALDCQIERKAGRRERSAGRYL